MRSTTRTGVIAGAIAMSMVGAAYASVPLYRMFCQATGFGGTTARADESALPGADKLAALHGKTIDVRFDGNVANGIAWDFKPEKTIDTVKIGERRMAFFRATNLSNRTVTGQASFNVAPDTAGAFFTKIQCFCFTEQTLKPGETVEMPVTYFVDPAILADPDGKRIEEITLSYTFYPVDTPVGAGQKANETARREERAPTQG